MAYQPKSYKKFVATAATATLVATAVVPAAFADEATTAAFTDVPASYEAAVEFVVEQAIAKGISETQFGIPLEIKRGDVAIMIANAAGINDPDAPSAGFTDVPKRGALAINSLKAAGVVNGKTATNFGFDDSITRGEAAIMLANAFPIEGDVEDVKFTDVGDRYDEAVAALIANDVTNGINATQFGTQNPIKRGDFAKFLYALEEYIVDETPASPEVLSVEATDANTIVLQFNVVLDEESVEDNNFFSVVANDTEGLASDATLSADGKTVTLELAAGDELQNEDEVSVTVDKDLQTAAGENFAEVDFVKNFIFNDEVAPTVSAISTPNGDLRIAFSEQLLDPTDSNPINLVVDGQSLTLGTGEAAWVTGNVITIPKADVDADFDLTAGSSYSVAIAGAQDLVGNEMSLFTDNFTYQVVTDKTAPKVTEVSAGGEDVVSVEFSEEVTVPTAVVEVNGEDVDAANFTVVPAVEGATFSTDYEVVFNADYDLFAEGSSVKVEVELSGAKDLGNNLMTTVTETVTLTEDKTAPKVASTTYDADEELVVIEFNEDVVDAGKTLLADDFTIIDTKTSKVVTLSEESFDIDNSDDSILISGLSAGSYSIKVGEGVVEDVSRAGNDNATFTTNVTVPVVAATEVTVEAAASEADDEITVVYSDVVTGGTGSKSAANPSNYRLDGEALPTGTVITLEDFAGENGTEYTVATITLPEGSIESTRTAILTVSNVEADNGTIVPTESLLVDVEDTQAPTLASVEVDGTELVLSFSEAVEDADANDFVVRVNGVVVADAVAEAITTETTEELVITSDSVSFATGTITVQVDNETVVDADVTDITDVEENELVVSTVTATR